MKQVDDEEELKRAALDNISKSQRTFKYPIVKTEDENGKVDHNYHEQPTSTAIIDRLGDV